MAINLPHDVHLSILLLLPVKTLLRFKSTCKLWLSSIQSQQFIKTHRDLQIINQQKQILLAMPLLDRKFPQHRNIGYPFSLLKSLRDDQIKTNLLYSSNLPQKYIHRTRTHTHQYIHYISCCHGLVFMALWDGSMVLWNPGTRKYHEIAPYRHNDGFDPATYALESSLHHAYCFGHDSSLDDYKILRLKREIENGPDYIDLYSVNNSSWTNMGLLSSEYEFPWKRDPVMFNGVFHFISTYKKTRDNHESTQTRRLIMSFCLVEGMNIKIYKPDDEIKTLNYFVPMDLCVFQQKLSISVVIKEGYMKNIFEVWSIMNYGENSSTCWNRIISISYNTSRDVHFCGYSARFIVKDEVLVIMAANLEGRNGYLIYDTRKLQFIKILEFLDHLMVFDYVETLVSPGLLINT